MPHNSINLELKKDKPDNVWRYIYAWKEVACSHGQDIRYLFLHALVQWGANKEHIENVFTIAIQYSSTIGKNVDVSQPAHILEKDVIRVQEEFREFTAEHIGKHK